MDLFATNIYLVTGDLTQFNANEPDLVAKLTWNVVRKVEALMGDICVQTNDIKIRIAVTKENEW